MTSLLTPHPSLPYPLILPTPILAPRVPHSCSLAAARRDCTCKPLLQAAKKVACLSSYHTTSFLTVPHPLVVRHPLRCQAGEKRVADAEKRKLERAARAWKAYTEDKGGKVYYYNAQTKVSTYDKPVSDRHSNLSPTDLLAVRLIPCSPHAIRSPASSEQ